MYFLFKMGIFHCYVCLPECNGYVVIGFHVGFPSFRMSSHSGSFQDAALSLQRCGTKSESRSLVKVEGPPQGVARIIEKNSQLRGSGYLGYVDSNQGYNTYKWVICPITRVINLHITSY